MEIILESVFWIAVLASACFGLWVFLKYGSDEERESSITFNIKTESGTSAHLYISDANAEDSADVIKGLFDVLIGSGAVVSCDSDETDLHDRLRDIDKVAAAVKADEKESPNGKVFEFTFPTGKEMMASAGADPGPSDRSRIDGGWFKRAQNKDLEEYEKPQPVFTEKQIEEAFQPRSKQLPKINDNHSHIVSMADKLQEALSGQSENLRLDPRGEKPLFQTAYECPCGDTGVRFNAETNEYTKCRTCGTKLRLRFADPRGLPHTDEAGNYFLADAPYE